MASKLSGFDERTSTIVGNSFGTKIKYLIFLRKRMNTNPTRRPIHFLSSSKMIWRTVRYRLPHKTQRSADALGQVKVFEGNPAPYDKIMRMVMPNA